MIDVENVGLLLLASGLSRRFGAENKLMHPLAGRPLLLHAAATYASIPFQVRVAVCPPDPTGPKNLLSPADFTIVENPDADTGQATSITSGLRALLQTRPQAVLIALGDMPFVSKAHIYKLVRQCSLAASGIAASARADGTVSPPAVFAERHIETLLELQGDKGARDLIRSGDRVSASDRELADIDTQEDYSRWEESGR